jgi:hypothetical protein
VKTAKSKFLTFSIWAGMFVVASLLARHSLALQDNGQVTQNSVPAPGHDAQLEQSNSAPAAAESYTLPSDQVPEAMSESMMGVDNGLWEGCDVSNGCSICGGGYCTPPLWYTTQGARVLNRSAPRKTTTAFEFRETDNATQSGEVLRTFGFTDVLNTHSINYNVAPGYQATIGRYLGRDASDRDDFLEFSYWGMNTFSDTNFYDAGSRNVFQVTTADGRFTYSNGGRLSTHFLVDNPGLFNQPSVNISNFGLLQWGVGGFDHVDTQTMRVDSEIHNFELNLRLRPRGRPDQLVMHPDGRWRRECRPGTFMSYLVGLRYMTVGDGFHLNSRGSVTVTDNDTGDTDTRDVFGAYHILTENDLLGFQIGTDLMFRRCKWAWGVRSKVGPYVNFSRNIKEISNIPFGAPAEQIFFNDRYSQQRQKAALIGEVGFEATYRFKPNLIGRAAYDFSWITGLALAPEQLTWNLTPNGNDTINTNGTIYAHGISLGLEWCW